MRYLIKNIPIPVAPGFVAELAAQLGLPFSGTIVGQAPDLIVEATRPLTEQELATLQTAVKAAITAQTGIVEALPE